MSNLLMEHDGTITLFSSLINLVVRLYCHLTFDSHIIQLCKASSYHLKSISELQPRPFIPFRHKNGRSLQKHQYIQIMLARTCKQHIFQSPASLPWLSVSSRNKFKCDVLTFQCIHREIYFASRLLQPHKLPMHTFRPNNVILLWAPRTIDPHPWGLYRLCSCTPTVVQTTWPPEGTTDSRLY